MPDPQAEPPWPEHGFTPRMYSEWIDDLWQWLRDHRVVAVNGGALLDAPGGGKIVEVALTPTTIDDRGFRLIPAGPGKVRVTASLLAGALPTGFTLGDNPPFLLTIGSSSIVYGKVVWDTSLATAGAITSRTIEAGASVPADVTTGSTATFYYEIGTVAVAGGTVTTENLRYGPIETTIARQWFTNPKTFFVEGQ